MAGLIERVLFCIRQRSKTKALRLVNIRLMHELICCSEDVVDKVYCLRQATFIAKGKVWQEVTEKREQQRKDNVMTPRKKKGDEEEKRKMKRE